MGTRADIDDARTADAWLAHKRAALTRVELEPSAASTGRVEQIADGIAFVSGLPDAALGEVVEIECGVRGFIHSLDAASASVVMVDGADAVRAGMRVARSGGVLDVPVGDALLGRIVDPLGRPLDGGEAIAATTRLPVERAAPASDREQRVDNKHAC